jgi:hypothetical protein
MSPASGYSNAISSNVQVYNSSCRRYPDTAKNHFPSAATTSAWRRYQDTVMNNHPPAASRMQPLSGYGYDQSFSSCDDFSMSPVSGTFMVNHSPSVSISACRRCLDTTVIHHPSCINFTISTSIRIQGCSTIRCGLGIFIILPM